MTDLSLPPLFSAMASDGEPPFAVAVEQARAGCDAGLVVYEARPDILRAAIVFAPEVPLREAVIMLPLCSVGFQNAFGAIAPPEVSLHLEWNGNIRVNGGIAGRLYMAASGGDVAQEPDWLVVGLEIDFWPADDDTGNTPDVTALLAEGCGEVEAPALLEAWVRHTLVWINRWSDEGPRPVHNEWIGLVHGMDGPVSQSGLSGTFKGVDENFGMILQSEDATAIIPLTDILRETP